MNIKLSTKELLEPLRTVIGVVENKPTLPVLSHVLIQLKNQTLSLTTTDMEIEMKTAQTIQSKEETSFTLYAKNLIDIIRKSPENTIIELIVEESKIYIKTNNNSFELNTFNKKNFPILPIAENSYPIKINRNALKNLIENISFSMGNQDIRAYLNGIYLEVDEHSITAVATDGHRLSIGKIEQKNTLPEKKTLILPRKAVLELVKILNKHEYVDVDIKLSNHYFSLTSDKTTITSRLIDGNFPNYSQVVPTNFENSVIINRAEFLDALNQGSIFVEERTKGVRLIFKNTQLDIFSHSERGQAKTQISTKNFDKKIEIAFNIHYLISILEKLNTDEIEMIIPNNENQSCLLKSLNDEVYQYVVMPMKI